jgi:uncharacterized membrane protein (UPF0127 family)
LQASERNRRRPPARQAPGGAAGRLFVAVLAFFLLGAQTVDTTDLEQSFGSDAIVIDSGERACYRFQVYLARTSEQHRRGLMFVRQLPRFSGMLFVYPDSAMRSMWMKNTYIPLDILFIRADGSVASIAADTEPLSLQSIRSDEPIAYVLELNAGVSAALGIDTESRVYMPASAN